jgi:hypothetical protein
MADVGEEGGLRPVDLRQRLGTLPPFLPSSYSLAFAMLVAIWEATRFRKPLRVVDGKPGADACGQEAREMVRLVGADGNDVGGMRWIGPGAWWRRTSQTEWRARHKDGPLVPHRLCERPQSFVGSIRLQENDRRAGAFSSFDSGEAYPVDSWSIVLATAYPGGPGYAELKRSRGCFRID